MSKALLVIAACVVCATADVFYWNKNNNFETATNWEVDGAGCAGADASKDCPDVRSSSVIFAGKVSIPDADSCSQENVWTDKIGRIVQINSVRFCQ